MADKKSTEWQTARIERRPIERTQVGLRRRDIRSFRIDPTHAALSVDQQPERRLQLRALVEQVAVKDGVGCRQIRICFPQVQCFERHGESC